jgi:membrane-bound metal-dependent hydrolase YbcI (DUF457 family)
MPSPVGHFLGGVAAAWLAAPAAAPGGACPRFSLTGHTRTLLLCGIAGVAPDLDIILGMHRTVTHSIGGSLAVFLIALAILGVRRARLAATLAAAVASHFLLDLVSYDANQPSGVMMLWPFTRQYFMLPLPVFLPIAKEFWTSGFYTHNAVAIVREVLILGPVLALVAWVRSRRRLASLPPPDTRLIEEQ